MKKPYNKLWYVAEEDMARYKKNTKVCYEHDNPDCKVCPRCLNSQLCENCWEDFDKHSEAKTRICLRQTSKSLYEYKELESAIATMCSHHQVMKEIKLDGEIIYQRNRDKQ